MSWRCPTTMQSTCGVCGRSAFTFASSSSDAAWSCGGCKVKWSVDGRYWFLKETGNGHRWEEVPSGTLLPLEERRCR